MKIFVVYCHPSSNSFTSQVRDSFLKGLADAGHEYVVSDLYGMNFNPVFSESEYMREAFYDLSAAVPDDVLAEQAKINASDAIAFIYPDFWTDAPALLAGWFQRVWTYGFAYGDSRTMKTLEKALFLVTMGGCLKDSHRVEQVEAMKTVMLGDRINDRAKKAEFVVFDEMTRGYGNDGNRCRNTEKFIKEAYGYGYNF